MDPSSSEVRMPWSGSRCERKFEICATLKHVGANTKSRDTHPCHEPASFKTKMALYPANQMAKFSPLFNYVLWRTIVHRWSRLTSLTTNSRNSDWLHVDKERPAPRSRSPLLTGIGTIGLKTGQLVVSARNRPLQASISSTAQALLGWFRRGWPPPPWCGQ
jgi:hypothetical protein